VNKMTEKSRMVIHTIWFETDREQRGQVAVKFNEISIRAWHLTIRTKNQLLRHNPSMTIADVILADHNILKIYGLGKKSVEELNSKVYEILNDSINIEQLAANPPKIISEPAIEVEAICLPAEIAERSIGLLHLPIRITNAIVKSGITTIAQLAMLSTNKIYKIPGVARDGAKQIEKALTALRHAVLPTEQFDWTIFLRTLDVIVLPANIDTFRTPKIALEVLPQLIKEILATKSDERLWIIIHRRFGLLGTSTLTLEELGIAFGLTRERVRQLEEKVINELRSVLIENNYAGKSYHVHPELLTLIQSTLQIITDAVGTAITNSKLMALLEQKFGTISAQIIPSINLLLTLSGVRLFNFGREDLEQIRYMGSEEQFSVTAKAVELIDRLLTVNTGSPMSEVDILIEVNKQLRKNQRLNLEQLRSAINLCSTVEQRTEGYYWGKFQYLSNRGHQMERILLEHGEPRSISEIAREINYRLALSKTRVLNDRNLVNQISRDDRFVPIGRSGEWGLKSWSIDTTTILGLMKQFLIAQNRPVTVEEIYQYVSERRPVSRDSIIAYLTLNNLFSRISREHWGLAGWSEARGAQLWNPIEVAHFVENLFKRHKTKKLEYKLVKKSLMDTTGLSERQVQGLLNINPVIATEREPESKVLYAYFQSNYQEQLQNSTLRFRRKAKTLRELVADYTQQKLQSSPGHQIALNELVADLVAHFKRLDKTFYHYISELDFIEKFTIPDTRTTICRLKSRNVAFPFSQVEEIQTIELRTKVGRALTFLNEADVDIALFLLSKEFEATLKDYINIKISKKRMADLPQGRLTLDGMINHIEKEGIITDKAVLHFLRQKRNDRAHGTMPTIDERKMMMKHAETTAGMYIDYIKFFDDLTIQIQ
jgi:hypothetical protein